MSDDESFVELFCEVVSEGDGFWEVVSCVDVEEWEWEACWSECFFSEFDHDDGVFAAAEEECGAFELCGDLAHDVYCLCFEVVEVADVVAFWCHAFWVWLGVWLGVGCVGGVWGLVWGGRVGRFCCLRLALAMASVAKSVMAVQIVA